MLAISLRCKLYIGHQNEGSKIIQPGETSLLRFQEQLTSEKFEPKNTRHYLPKVGLIDLPLGSLIKVTLNSHY